MFSDRKASYKLPPTTIRDKLISQETRRNKALEEQKKRRAQRIDSARQLDKFAGLNLGGSDDEDDAEDDESVQTSHPAPASVAQYASMLAQPRGDVEKLDIANGKTSFEHVIPASNGTSGSVGAGPSNDAVHEHDVELKKRPKKRKNKRKSNKPTKWADRCMYAELLEMVSDEPWSSSGNEVTDGLPKDLETGWVALAPVPVGKRCLAVTHQSAGVVGIAPNTTLRSRLLGKTLIQRFPSSLPPLTILDCILDVNWRENGILHVLDVVKWKGQDVGDCEAGFRFWWRDTRIAELTQTVPPSSITSFHPPQFSRSGASASSSKKYRFPYPTTFIPVPYHTNTTLISLDSIIVPAARAVREVDVVVPSLSVASLPPTTVQESMDIEPLSPAPSLHQPTLSQRADLTDQVQQTQNAQAIKAQIQPDGLLLYVAEASFEPGTSPLSSWVPITAYEEKDYEREQTEGIREFDVRQETKNTLTHLNEGPLSLFERLVRRRLARRTPGLQVAGVSTVDVEMDM